MKFQYTHIYFLPCGDITLRQHEVLKLNAFPENFLKVWGKILNSVTLKHDDKKEACANKKSFFTSSCGVARIFVVYSFMHVSCSWIENYFTRNSVDLR